MKPGRRYWFLLAPLVGASLKKRYGKAAARRAMAGGKRAYRALVAGAPPLGRGNPMAVNAYFAYVFVGVWLGTDRKLRPDELALVMTDVLGRMRFLFGLVDLNRHPSYWESFMRRYARWYDAGGGARYPSTWKVRFEEGRHRDGSFYAFSRCPICSYLSSLGLGEVMAPLCGTDRVMFAYQHGVLHREHTIACGGNECDYWIVGDRTADPR